jgi:hypothetical protein
MLGRLCGSWPADNRRRGAGTARVASWLANGVLKVAILKQQPGSRPLTCRDEHPSAGLRPKD